MKLSVHTYGCNEKDDDEGVEDGYDGCTDSCHNILKVFQTAKESQDPKGPQYLKGGNIA
jgi:hypothetical protein